MSKKLNFYLISPPDTNLNFNADNFDKISDIIPISFFQFRPKHRYINQRLNFVEKHYYKISKICESKRINLIINNDFQIAKKFSFNGIHLGQTDKSCLEAKKIFGKKFIVGVSCGNSVKFYDQAKKQKADYVAFGPVFKTISKNKKIINVRKTLQSINNLRLPFTLIGGINHSNFMQLNQFKPSNIAIINSFWNYEEGPLESALLFKKIMENNKKK